MPFRAGSVLGGPTDFGFSFRASQPSASIEFSNQPQRQPETERKTIMKNTLKNIAFHSLVVLTLLFSVSAGRAFAQTVDRMSFKIPFEFHVGNARFAPGDYEMQTRVNQDPLLFKLRSVENNSTVLFYTLSAMSAREPETSQLIFSRYGNEYFLRKVWREGAVNQRELPASSAERKLRKKTHDKKDYFAMNASPGRPVSAGIGALHK
jgi:hypothetical protein